MDCNKCGRNIKSNKSNDFNLCEKCERKMFSSKLKTSEQRKIKRSLRIISGFSFVAVLAILALMFFNNYLDEFSKIDKFLGGTEPTYAKDFNNKNNTTNSIAESASTGNQQVFEGYLAKYLNNSNDKALTNTQKNDSHSNSNTSGSTTNFSNNSTSSYVNHTYPEIENEIKENNSQIAQYQEYLDMLASIKSDYDNEVSAINAWYNEEYDTAYAQMMKNKKAYDELGGYATLQDVADLTKELETIREKFASMGLTDSGTEKEAIKSLNNSIKVTGKRVSYSKEYDKYHYYINTTLPSQKNDKLLGALKKYEKRLSDFKTNNGL